jgi:hypothetical protein
VVLADNDTRLLSYFGFTVAYLCEVSGNVRSSGIVKPAEAGEA